MFIDLLVLVITLYTRSICSVANKFVHHLSIYIVLPDVHLFLNLERVVYTLYLFVLCICTKINEITLILKRNLLWLTFLIDSLLTFSQLYYFSYSLLWYTLRFNLILRHLMVTLDHVHKYFCLTSYDTRSPIPLIVRCLLHFAHIPPETILFLFLSYSPFN